MTFPVKHCVTHCVTLNHLYFLGLPLPIRGFAFTPGELQESVTTTLNCYFIFVQDSCCWVVLFGNGFSLRFEVRFWGRGGVFVVVFCFFVCFGFDF